MTEAVTDAVSRCGKSRAQIADEMSYLTGERITDRMLYAWTSEAKEKHRFPAEYVQVFCFVSGDDTLLRALLANTRAGDLLALAELDVERETLQRKTEEARRRLVNGGGL